MVVGPADHAERRPTQNEPGDTDPDQQRPRQDRLVRRPRLPIHQALPWAAVAEADGLEYLRREVHVQRLQWHKWDAADDVEDARSEEGDDEADEHPHLEADVLRQVVVEAAAELDRLDDGREVVVGEDHRRGLLRDLGAGDPHRDADVGALQSRSVVHAVAGHRDDVALSLQRLDEAHLVLGRDARDHADLVDGGVELVVGHRLELRAGDRLAGDAELAGDRRRRDGVVAGDHAHLHAGPVRGRNRCLRGRARRVDDPGKGEHGQPVELRQQVVRTVERVRIEVLTAGRHHTKALARQALVLVHVTRLELLVDRHERQISGIGS